MGNKSRFSSGQRRQQQSDYRPPSSSINQPQASSSSRRDSRPPMFDQYAAVAPERPPALPPPPPQQQQQQPHSPPLGGSNKQPSADSAGPSRFERENPTKITHGFWLQQYSWLHNDNSLGGGGGSGSGSGTFASDTGAGKQRTSNASMLPSRPQVAAATPATAQVAVSRRRRLLNRWNNLVRTFGGSHGDNLMVAVNQDRTATPSLVSPGYNDNDNDDAEAEAQCQMVTATSSAPSTAHSTLAKSSGQSEARQRARNQHQQHDATGNTRQFKWASPSRWRPSSSAAATTTEAEVATYDGSAARATPDSERRHKASSSACESGRKRGRRGWFMKSLSNSTSTLMSPAPAALPVAASQQQQHQYGTRDTKEACGLELPGDGRAEGDEEDRSKSSCELRTLEGAVAAAAEDRSSAQARPRCSSSKHLVSPYRQIVRALASRSPTRRRQRKQQQLDESGELPATMAGERPKRSRLMQFAFSATGGSGSGCANQQQVVVSSEATGAAGETTQVTRHQQSSSPSLLGSLFVSPLFRRGETKTSKLDSKVKQKKQGRRQQQQDPSKLIGSDKAKRAASSHDYPTNIASQPPLLHDEGGSEIRGDKRTRGQDEADGKEVDLGDILVGENGHQFGAAPRGAGGGQMTTGPSSAADGGRSEVDRRKPTKVCLASSRHPSGGGGGGGGGGGHSVSGLDEDVEMAKKSSEGASEFKFQLERRNYYANETKVVTRADADSRIKCCLEDDHHGHDEGDGAGQVSAHGRRLASTDSGQLPAGSKREIELGPGKGLDGRKGKVAEVAQGKRVKVIHDHEREAHNAKSCGTTKLDSNGFGGDGQAGAEQYESGICERYVELKSFAGQEDMDDDKPATTTTTGNQMRASKTEEAIVASTGNGSDDNDDDDGGGGGGGGGGAAADYDYGYRRLNERSLLPLIQPLASSSSSFSSICFDSASQHAQDHVSDNDQPNQQQQQLQQQAIPTASPHQAKPTERPASTPVTRKRSPAADPSNGRATNLTNDPATSGSVGGGPGSRQKVGHAPSSGGVGMLKNNFKKLVKRQQSVDSYRMARDLKNKLKRQHEVRNKHQSNEAIKTKSVGDDRPADLVGGGSARRKFSMLMNSSGGRAKGAADADDELVCGSGSGVKLRICIDPYAKPGSFTLPGEDRLVQDSTVASDTNQTATTTTTTIQEPKHQQSTTGTDSAGKLSKLNPTPPNTLSLMPQQPGGFVVGSFSGCITPTYPTHHLPSPKYGPPPASKKYSNASTISSSLGGESHATNFSLLSHAATSPGQQYHQHHQLANRGAHQQATAGGATSGGTATNQSDTESSMGGGGGGLAGSPSKQTIAGKERGASIGGGGGGGGLAVNQSSEFGGLGSQQSSRASGLGVDSEQALAMAAARRAQLAEHIYDNKCGLGEDMKFLASLPELCDITFLVGETREPVCAVKSVLAARSRVFHKILFGNRTNRRIARQPRQEDEGSLQQQQQQSQLVDSTTEMDRRSSSPRPPVSSQLSQQHKPALAAKSSSPAMAGSRNTSPSQPNHQQWSVMADTSGYNPAGSSASPVQSITGDDQPQQQQQGRSGRVSVTSNGGGGGGRDSGISHTSQGSQQPLIIGPGQMATPAPSNMTSKGRHKKSSTRADGGGSGGGGGNHGGSRLSRMFMKRASDPSIKQQQHNKLSNASQTTQSYLDKMSSSQMSTTMIIEEFEPDVFRQLIEYIHTGCVLLQARTLLGLLNAADYYGLEQLRKACLRFVSCCITVDTVCSLLSTAERYIQYKCTKSIVQKVLEFVDNHADEIFKLNAFGLLPEHVVRLILSRDGLQADEHVKYNGVYTWCEHYCRSYELTNISDVMRNFIDLIQFHRIPTNVLLGEIYPTHIVPDNIFLSALAYQADPLNFEPQPMQTRRMTLPNPTIYSKQAYDDDDDDGDGANRDGSGELGGANSGLENQENSDESMMLLGRTAAGGGGGGGPGSLSRSGSRNKRKSASELQAKEARGSDGFYGSQVLQKQMVQKPAKGAVGGRKSTGGQPDNAGGGGGGGKAGKLRKGSIAQVSISGVMRLSHKLSIKKRPPLNVAASSGGQQTAQSRRRIGSYASSSNVLPSSGGSRRSAVSKQQSAIDGAGNHRDPMQLGQQILTAYLEQQRQRELELEERKRQEELERLAAEEAKRRSEQGDTQPAGSSPGGTSELQPQEKQPIVKSSSTRKSFKDFRHISRRIFMRHSSSKLLQQQHSSASSTTTTTTPVAMASTTQTAAPAAGQLQTSDNKDKDNKDKDNKDKDKGAGAAKASKRRNMLKIKRSETVFETTATCSSGAPT